MKKKTYFDSRTFLPQQKFNDEEKKKIKMIAK